MPAADSPAILVAHYLKSNNYTETLATFLHETNLTPEQIAKDASTTIESLLDEKRLYDLSLNLQNTELTPTADAEAWSEPSPSVPTPLEITPEATSNILSVAVTTLRVFPHPVIVTTTASRHLLLHSAVPPYPLLHTHGPFPSPLLTTTTIAETHILTASMTGALTLLNPTTGKTTHSATPHTKYATRLATHGEYLASSAYDNTIVLHRIIAGPKFTEIARITTVTQPETLAFTLLPGAGAEPALVYTRRDSPELVYLSIPALTPVHTLPLADAATSFLSFHGGDIAVHPCDPRKLAVASSHTPTLKVFYIRDGEVEGEFWTGAEQGAYSMGVVGWREGGRGVWVNADDGGVRGVGGDGRRGKVLQVTEGGMRVRCLWGGRVGGEAGAEVLVTGGFDKRVVVWNCPKEGEGDAGDGAAVGTDLFGLVAISSPV